MVHKTVQYFVQFLKYLTLNSNFITKWTSKGLFNDSLEAVSTSSKTLYPLINYYGEKVRQKFTGSILQQKKVTYNYKKVVNFYVVYEISTFHEYELC